MSENPPKHPELFQKLSKALAEPEEGGDYLQLSYRLGFSHRHNGLLLWVYEGNKLITRFEKFGIHALGLHRFGTPQSELDPEHRRLAQNLLRFANLNPSEGYFFIPRKQVPFFLSKLGKFTQVRFAEGQAKVKFSSVFLLPLIQLKEITPQQIQLSASFQDSETGNILPFADSKAFISQKSWVLMGDTFYPLKSSLLTSLVEDFDSAGMLTLTGAEAADFIQNYLPLLSKKPLVQLPEAFAIPEVQQLPAEARFEISEHPTEDRLILEIQFSYDSHLVPPHQQEDDVLFKLVTPEGDRWIRRDLAQEKEVLGKFLDMGFHRVGSTRFETGGEKAMDFVSNTLPALTGSIQGKENLRRFHLVGEMGTPQIQARVVSSGIDWLEVEMGFDLEGLHVPFDVIQSLYSQGKNYLRLPSGGFAKLNADQLSELGEKIAELEGEMGPGGKLKISRFHAAYLDEAVKVDWSQSQEIGRMIQGLKEVQQIPPRPLPANLSHVLREYQHHGFDWMNFLKEYRFQGILADDMGLGKTVQALAYLQDEKDRLGSAPNLVVAPTSVVFNWVNEAEKFTPSLKTLVFSGPHRKRLFSKIPEADLVITSYALFRRDVERMKEQSWRTVILDEAQNIKNYRSKTSQLVKTLNAEQRWALTGTPLENHLSELWSIFDFLMPGFLGSFSLFKKKFQIPIEVEKSSAQLERLKRRIYPFILRRLKQEVAKELPPKTEIINFCEMTGEQQKLYHEVLVACRQQVFAEVEKRGIERSQVSILTALLRLRQVCCHPRLMGSAFHARDILSGKMEAFKELVTEVISEGHRILVFSQFVEMLTLLRHWLEGENIRYEYLDGRTRQREKRVHRFNTDPEIPLFLVSLRAGGTGLNLTGADYVIHYDPWWNPAVQDQATDRAHRIGQKKHVFSYKLITKDSVEEKILLLQENKKNLAKDLLSADSALGKRLSYEDLEFLFS